MPDTAPVLLSMCYDCHAVVSVAICPMSSRCAMSYVMCMNLASLSSIVFDRAHSDSPNNRKQA